jgi:NitT/TauT family transport system substrate-binding protein
VQKVVDALVATMHRIHTHSAADIANAMPSAFVSDGLTTKAAYIAELAQHNTNRYAIAANKLEGFAG